MNFTKIKKFGKYLAAAIATGAVASMAIFPALGLRADSPRFNFLDGDLELFTGANTTNNETVWKDPVTIKAGDTFEGLVYYHNGIVDSVAKNTTIKVSLPEVSGSTSAQLSATLSADNAQEVSDTIIDGEINGLTGLNIKTNDKVTLEYVPGSVKWYPNSKKLSNTPVELPFDQSGSELFSAKGLNIGDINGCWDYAGFVKFAVRTKIVANNSINIEKTVKNISDDQANYSESTKADQSEKVEFKLDVTSSGNTTLENVNVNDLLPGDLSVVAGSAKLIKNGQTTSISETDLLSNGVNIGEMIPGQIEEAVITFQATVPTQISQDKTVVNTAKVKSGELNDQDTANVVLNAGNIKISISKSAFNITQNIDATKVTAHAGDIIEYTLNTENTGSLNTEKVVEDGIGDVAEYATVLSISDSGFLVDGTANTNDAKIVRYPKQTLNAGTKIANTFKVQVKNPLPSNAQDGYHYDYKMFNTYGNDVLINIEKPILKPSLSIAKYVRNVTSNELDFVDSDTAYAGDLLEYKIVIKNSGEGSADYVKVSDALPANVSLDTTSAAILGINGVEKSIAEDITNGYKIETLAPGQEAYIRFRVMTNSQLAANEKLVNTAYAEDDGKSISDTADTVIKQKVVVTNYVEKKLARTGSENSVIMSLLAAMLLTGGLAVARQKVR